MKQKLIPIYREIDSSNKKESTFLLDTHSQRMYKTVKREDNDYTFWIAWVLALALLRSIKSFHLSISSPITILIILSLFVISGGLGVYKYKDTNKNKREIFITQDMIEEYIERGKYTLKSDLRVTIVTFLVFVTLTVLFLIYQWLIWLLFALFLFFTFVMALSYLSIERLKLYSKKSE